MSSISMRRISTGTPVPIKSREERSQVNSEVTTYTLPPEELERYRSMDKPKPKQNRPLNTWERRSETQVRTFELSRKEYLMKRKSGMNKSDIAKEQGITAPTLVYWLGKWDLKDPAVEELEIASLSDPDVTPQSPAPAVVNDAPVDDVNKCSAQYPQEDVDNSASTDVLHVNIRIPVIATEWPDELKSAALTNVDRNTLIRLGIICLQNAACWAQTELVDIIGASESDKYVQSFMERKCNELSRDEMKVLA